MSDSWVGFRPSPKKDDSRPIASKSFSFSTQLMIAKVLKLLTERDGVQSWLVEFTKFNCQLGAKLRFTIGEENYGGTYARIDIPKRVVLLTELHGEIDFKLLEKKDGTDIEVSFTKTINESERAHWDEIVELAVERFTKKLSHG
jgi:hypothetical protein